MADTKTSAELSASTLTGSELLRVVQGGVDRKTTLNAIVADLGLTGGGGSGGAPTNAEYILGTDNALLPNARTFANNTVIERDTSVAGQISYTLVDIRNVSKIINQSCVIMYSTRPVTPVQRCPIVSCVKLFPGWLRRRRLNRINGR